jgi:hypothetical protein
MSASYIKSDDDTNFSISQKILTTKYPEDGKQCICCRNKSNNTGNHLAELDIYRINEDNEDNNRKRICNCDYYIHEKCVNNFKEDINEKCPVCNYTLKIEEFKIKYMTELIVDGVSSDDIIVKDINDNNKCHIIIDMEPKTLFNKIKGRKHIRKSKIKVKCIRKEQLEQMKKQQEKEKNKVFKNFLYKVFCYLGWFIIFIIIVA